MHPSACPPAAPGQAFPEIGYLDETTRPMMKDMGRRRALRHILAAAGLATTRSASATTSPDRRHDDRGSFSLDGTRLRFFHPSIRQRESFLMLADTHLFRDDPRGEPFRTYSNRMARAYNRTRHFLTGEETQPEACFRASLDHAVQKGFSKLALVGDILSFPSEAGVEWTMQQLAAAGIPHVYTAGNHDWHYEGMEGSSADLRRDWCRNRLAPLYKGTHPLMHLEPMGDVDMLLIDNSTYEILPEQLDFFRERERKGRPMLLLLHIPLYVPGRPLGFGCGHPDWKAENDRSWQLERRQPWRSDGHSRTTMAFHRAVFRSDHVMGILAGHIHSPSVDVIDGIPQIVTEANARGAHLEVELLPMSTADGAGPIRSQRFP